MTRPRFGPRSQVAIPSAVRLLVDGDAEHATAAIEQVAPDLGPAERADAALVVEQVAERVRERQEGSA